MKEYTWEGKSVSVMQEIDDPKYGKVLLAYVDHIKAYIINGSIVTDREIIDYLDNNYGRPTWQRDIEL